jgi:hypothetical protein
MTWNYRVVRTEHANGEIIFGIHEAYYDEGKDEPHSITDTPDEPYGETLEELVECIERFKDACSKPVLELKNGKVVEWKPQEHTGTMLSGSED